MTLYSAPRIKCKGFLQGLEAQGRALLAAVDVDDEALELQKYGFCVNARKVCRLLQTAWLRNFAVPLPTSQENLEQTPTLQGILDKVSELVAVLGRMHRVDGRVVRWQVDRIHEELTRVTEQHPARGCWEEEDLTAEVPRSALKLFLHLRVTLLQAYDHRNLFNAHAEIDRLNPCHAEACFLGKIREWLTCCFAPDWPGPRDVAEMPEEIDELEESLRINNTFNSICTKKVPTTQGPDSADSANSFLRAILEGLRAIDPLLQRFLNQELDGEDEEVESEMNWSESTVAIASISTELGTIAASLGSQQTGTTSTGWSRGTAGQSTTQGSWLGSSALQVSTDAPQSRQTVPDTIFEEDQELGGGHTLLHQAAMEGDLTRVKSLLQESRENVNLQDSGGDTPLMLAAHHGHEDLVKFLCAQADCDLFLQNLRGMNAWGEAKRQGHRVVEDILCHEVHAVPRARDPRFRNVFGRNPSSLEEAMDLGHFEDIAVLAADPATGRPDWDHALTIAARKGLQECVQYLVEARADVNAKYGKGSTPLHSATLHGRLELAKYLVEADADINVKDNDGETPLDRVCSFPRANRQHKEPIENLLRAAGARSRWLEVDGDVNATNDYGQTLLHLAVTNGDLDSVKYFVKKGTCLSTQDEDGITPLALARQKEARAKEEDAPWEAKEYLKVCAFLYSKVGRCQKKKKNNKKKPARKQGAFGQWPQLPNRSRTWRRHLKKWWCINQAHSAKS